MLSRIIRIYCAALVAPLATFIVLAGWAMPAHAQSSAETPDENAKMVHYSLYYEDFKAGNYLDALNNVRWLLEHAPAYAGPGRSDDRNFERAVIIYDSLAQRADSPELARAYLDTAITMHDLAVSTLKDAGVEVDEFKWLRDKGRFIQQHSNQLPDHMGDAIALYEATYEMDPDRVDPYYLTVLIGHYAQNDRAEAVEFMEEVEQRHPENEELTRYIVQVRNALFRSPEERMEFLEQQLAKNPDDTDLVSELFDIYQDLGHRDKMYEIGERLMQMEPSAQTNRLMAKLRLDDGQPEAAFQLYEQAIEMAGEATVQDYYNMGIAQQQMGRLAQARTQFRRAIEVDSGFGPAYLAIGDLYATAVSNCGSFEREDQAVYWLVVDYYERAKRVDGSVASSADQKIRTYRRSFPDQEALFFKGWQAGQAYQINYGCYAWINESTTVKNPG